MPDFLTGLTAFAAYFAGSIVCGVVFCLIYVRLTPHKEFDLIVREHNAAAAIAFGGNIIGFAIALSTAVHVTQSVPEFAAWAVIAIATQVVGYLLAKLGYPALSAAIEQNVLAAGIWVASVAIAVGFVSSACMSP